MKKMIIVLALYITFNFFNLTYSMEMQNCIALQTGTRKNLFNNKTMISYITLQEAPHSSIISVKNEILLKKNLNNELITIEGDKIQKKIVKNFKAKEIVQFRKILHKPSFYSQLNNQQYHSMLFLAQTFKAPLLYAELLDTPPIESSHLSKKILYVNQLPPAVIKLITIKYIYLHDMARILENNLRHTKIMHILNKDIYRNRSLDFKLQKIKTDNLLIENYVRWSDKLKLSIIDLMEIITLPQAVLLSLICNAPRSSRIRMQLIPSMPGFNSFISLPEKYTDLLLEDLPIGLKKKLSQNNNYVLTEIVFNI